MGMFDALTGATPSTQPGALSSLAGLSLDPKRLVPVDMTTPVAPYPQLNSPPALRLGSPNGGLAPGNGWGDAPRTSGADDDGPSNAQRWAGIIGDALLTAFGHQSIYGPTAVAYAKTQMDPVDKAYKQALTAQAMRPADPKVGTFQQKVNDLRANGATDADIQALIQNETNPFQAVPGHDEQGHPTMTMIRPSMPGGIPAMVGASASPGDEGAGDLAVGAIVNGHRYMGGGTGNQANWQPVGGAPSQGGATFSPSQAYDAVIQQESGGRAGVTGPATPYGRAQGMSQMLPATAQAMAAKIGVPWAPGMMTGTSPAAANYQRQLGQAYFDEGLNKTGNVYDAARYYFAGPNRALWGPKTRAYADNIVSRLGG